MGLTDTVRAVLDHKGIGVCAVMPETPVYEALEIMADKDIGAVLVMEDAYLCGIFSERDYARKVILQGKASRDTTVGEIMTSPPVVSQEAVIGMLSIGDLVNWIIRRQEEEIHHLHHYITGSYPA